MCLREMFLFSLFYSLANFSRAQAGSNLFFVSQFGKKTFFRRSFQNGGVCVDVSKNRRLLINSKEISHLWGSCSGRCPDRKSNDLCSPWADLFIRPVYLGLNPKRTWKGCGSFSVGDSLLPVSVLAWLAPASPFAGCCLPILRPKRFDRRLNF